MPRAPCCDQKLGLKKGPWTREEDQILINYVQNYGHANWRALPKQAGLLRCGKSCRLRWINYLQPNIKRGNFSGEEEDTIIHLHQTLGNRWSAIAARLPGRTDNEIKNVWHTHLKKRLNKNRSGQASPEEETKAVHEAEVSSYDEPSLSSSEYSSSDNINIGDLFKDEADDSVLWSHDDDMESNAAQFFLDGGTAADGMMDFWYNVFLQAEGNSPLPEC